MEECTSPRGGGAHATSKPENCLKQCNACRIFMRPKNYLHSPTSSLHKTSFITYAIYNYSLELRQNSGVSFLNLLKATERNNYCSRQNTTTPPFFCFFSKPLQGEGVAAFDFCFGAFMCSTLVYAKATPIFPKTFLLHTLLCTHYFSLNHAII
jgi:hypothetical protein